MQRNRIFGLIILAAVFLTGAGPNEAVPVPRFSLIASSAPGTAQGDRYTVQQDDTLGSIAARAGVRVADVAAANSISDPDLIRVGTSLLIPRGPGAKPAGVRPSAPRPTAATATPTLRPGTTGPAVADAQRRLTTAGLRVTADGSFGPRTGAAVTAFQKKKGLQADGVVGPRTWTALGRPVGTPLAGPKPATPGVPPGPWRAYGAKAYTAKSGDSWTKVAKAQGMPAEALAAANQRTASQRLPAGTVVSVPGAWRCPVPGGIFVNDWHFARRGHLHEGTDLFAPRGTPVRAPVAGNAVRHPNGLGGRSIQLYGADGNRYYFAHLDGYRQTGQVAPGTVIGTVGNSGNAATTVTHLHFEVHPGGGAAVNPFPTLVLACKRS